MYTYPRYQEEINKEAINLMTLPNKNCTKEACTIRLIFDEINGTVNNQEDDFVPVYRMFVDNLLSAITPHLKQTRHFVTSSIESFYFIFTGYP